MRVTRALITTAILAGAMFIVDCSKQNSSPTAPPPADPSCSLSATSLNFGTVGVGASADAQFSITNSGAGTLSGTVVVSCAEFSLVGSGAYSLSAGQSATFTVRFAPTAEGARSCTIATGSAKCASIAAAGTGQAVPPACEVTPTSLDFGSVNYGATQNRAITVRNTGGGVLTGSIGGTTTAYTVIGSSTFSLGAGALKSFFVQFQPSSGGAQTCTLRVDPPGCAPVVGRGFGLLPVYGDCAVRVTSGDTLDFGEVSLGQTLERTVTVQNTSSSFPSSGGASDICLDFESGFATNFLPGGSGARTVRFTPTRVGLQYCAVAFSCVMNGAGTNPGVQDYLICRGVGVGGNPQCQVSTEVITFGQVPVGQTKDKTFTVTNIGTGVLAGSAGPSPCTDEFTFVGPVTYALQHGESATLTVRYTPRNVGHTTSCPLVPVGGGCSTLTLVGEAIGSPAAAR